MIALGVQHKRHQDQERRTAGDTWEEHDLVWCQPNGRPIDARADWLDWKEILRLAGVRDARVHDGRHTAATMLLLLGVDERTVMAVMSWSDRRMLRRYQHVIDELRQEASRRISDLIFGRPEKPAKKSKKKAKKQRKEKNVDTLTKGFFATDLATEPGLAKIITFPITA